MRTSILTLAVVCVAAIAGLHSGLHAQADRSVWDGVYSEDQAKRGAALYDQHCAACHGEAGSGGRMAPALVGGAFSANYDGQTVGDLTERNRQTMPPGKEGQLSRQQIADIIAYMLQCNKFPSGPAELASQAPAQKQIKYLAVKPA